MIPQLLTLRLRGATGPGIRLWVPVLPTAIVASPLLLLAALAAAGVCRAHGISVARAFITGWRLLCALPGTRFELRAGGAVVLVRIW